MTQFTPKKYQRVEACFKAIHTFGRASLAFTAVTEDLWGQSLRYTPLAGFAPDTQAQKGRLQYWVRNLARREGASFFFQKANGRFYPDFVCKLNNDSFLIVEYKGANGWTDAKDDRDIGGLWAKLSKETCHFVMVKEKQWDVVDALLASAPN